ncbi:redoxin domain-containing protein [Paenisporosarcina quisquiliarum]|uniref:Redoxin domain-containing protein n=1 Tax=Paenisporosarcina quisquiliarum TaxID=365346 RepID=A0A9X3LF44_9BACL|nr:redoxin domain-containing protein [Paenisporosarcina quisquiliarum]MCZ8536607.1 redoxin domain-containing protein [Paenisporosarcina quisquiliarum]
MTKKLFGLVILAALIIIVIVTMVKNNMDQEKSIDNEQLGTEMTGVASSEGLNKGNTAPDFELTTLDGKKVKLSDYQGKKVILNFWATWCPPCKAEMPHMQNYYEDFAEQENVEILAVNLTSGDSADKVDDFVRDYGLTFPIPMDVEGAVGQTFEAITIPTSYMIDTKGRIQNKIVGPMDDQMIEDFVSKLE